MPLAKLLKRKKRADAVVVESDGFFKVDLFGPSDGSGCMPEGQRKEASTAWHKTKKEAIAEAKAFAKKKDIRIKSWK